MKSPEHTPARASSPPVFRYAPVSEIRIYEVTEDDLEKLANGSSDSLFLNFALALLPIGATLLVTLLTTKIESSRTFEAFVAICAVCFISGLFCLTRWWPSRFQGRHLLEEIKRRMPPPVGIQETGT